MGLSAIEEELNKLRRKEWMRKKIEEWILKNAEERYLDP
jgi:hypothetical protein